MSTRRWNFSIRGRLHGAKYTALLMQSCHWCKYALLVVQPGIELGQYGQATLKRLEPWLRKEEIRHSWPGTGVVGERSPWWKPSRVLTYQLDRGLINAFAEVTKSLEDWLQPQLPENLCILYEDESAWLMSITHEREFYLSIDNCAYRDLLREIPSITSYLVCEGHSIVGALGPKKGPGVFD